MTTPRNKRIGLDLARYLPALPIAAFLVILVRTAWVSDDAYITFRTVDNLTHGYGLRWNVAERVQSYTHPLWMMLIALLHQITGDPYYTSLVLSGTLTLGTLAAVFALAHSPAAALLGLTLLISSKAFVDYSTSGLENPLTHLLLALFWWLSWRHADRPGLLGIALSLILLNRMDLVLLVAPAIALAGIRTGSMSWIARFAAGLLPFAAWEVFSLIYYGVPFPNTAYAKLASTGLGRRDLAWQAVLYLRDSLTRDPLTLSVIVSVLVWTLVARSAASWSIAAGLMLYTMYIVRIGGDFMTGRFLTAPFLLAVLFFVHRGVPRWMTMRLAVATAVLIVVAFAPRSNFSGADFGSGDRLSYVAATGISDERAFYYQWTGLLPVLKGRQISETPWARQGRALAAAGPRVVPSKSVGIVGYYAGPGVHVVDVYGLCDPLLARLPSTNAWRIGHFERRIPDGYLETLSTNRPALRDPGLATFYQRIAAVTRLPLFSHARIQATIQLNLRSYDDLLLQWRETARVPETIDAFGTLD
jgi:arabinofuranosyltransferase